MPAPQNERKPAVSSELRIRPLLASDASFIRQSWLHSYAATSLLYSGIATDEPKPYPTLPRRIFDRLFRGEISKHLQEEEVLVACNPLDEQQIFGYIVFHSSPRHLFWLYTKQPFRHLGVAATLLEAAGFFPETPFTRSFTTRAAAKFFARYEKSLALP